MQTHGINFAFDHRGVPVYLDTDISEMLEPVQCKFCSHIHDAVKVEVTGRYSDCSMWKCPKCKRTLDDRPIDWGGSAIRLRKNNDW